MSVRLEAARSDLLGTAMLLLLLLLLLLLTLIGRGDLYEKRIAEIKENHEVVAVARIGVAVEPVVSV